MKIIIQRVKHASVTVNKKTVGKIGCGYLILLGIADNDTKEKVKKAADKISRLRIFSDENGKINLSIKDVGGEILVVSQFTLYADCRKGNRPSFVSAGAPDLANELYEYFIQCMKEHTDKVETGIFGADMQVELLGDGPFTIILEDGNGI